MSFLISVDGRKTNGDELLTIQKNVSVELPLDVGAKITELVSALLRDGYQLGYVRVGVQESGRSSSAIPQVTNF